MYRHRTSYVRVKATAVPRFKNQCNTSKYPGNNRVGTCLTKKSSSRTRNPVVEASPVAGLTSDSDKILSSLPSLKSSL